MGLQAEVLPAVVLMVEGLGERAQGQKGQLFEKLVAQKTVLWGRTALFY